MAKSMGLQDAWPHLSADHATCAFKRMAIQSAALNQSVLVPHQQMTVNMKPELVHNIMYVCRCGCVGGCAT